MKYNCEAITTNQIIFISEEKSIIKVVNVGDLRHIFSPNKYLISIYALVFSKTKKE